MSTLPPAQRSPNVAQFFKQPYPSAACDIFSCTNRAIYMIGKPEPLGTWNLCLKVCQKCAENIVASIPEELESSLPPPSGIGIAPREEIVILQARIEELKGLLAAVPAEPEPEAQGQLHQSGHSLQWPAGYQCRQCLSSFATSQAFANHVRRAHPKQKGDNADDAATATAN